MSRLPNLTPLMRPTSLQPSLRGPRDAAPPRVHSIATPEERAADTPADAPTPTEPKATNMTTPDQRVLDTLRDQGSLTRTELELETRLDGSSLVLALKRLRTSGDIVGTGPNRNQTYSLARSKPAKATKPAKKIKTAGVSTRTINGGAALGSFAAGVAQVEREMGTDLHPARLAAPMATASPFDSCADRIFDATAIPCRAIATANGGAIVLRGNQLTAELNAEELNVLHQLRG